MATFLSPSFCLRIPNHERSKPINLPKLVFINKTTRTSCTPLSQFSKSRFFQIKNKPFNQFLPNSPFLPLPISSLPKISCSHGPKPSFFTTFSQRATVLLVGSLLFLGRFNGRPALALTDAPKTYFSDTVEEKIETQKEKEGDEELYVKVLEKNPNDVEALKVVLYGKMRKGKPREAVKHVERLIALEPEEVEWRLLEALIYELMGQLSKAKRLFREILKERPLLLRALHGLALAMHKNHEGPAVFEMLNKALELARREERVTEVRNIRILIAQMHVVKGDLEEASKQFQDLVSKDPRDFRPYLCQGIVYSLLDKKKEADEMFEIYRNLIPDEFPQRGFINDVILASKADSQERLEKDFESEFSYKK